MTDILGECPVASAMKFDGRNDGIAAGRACWMISGGGCSKRLRHSRSNCCVNCEFYQRVMFEQEEKVSFRFATETV